jgi:hypothetical protein
MKPSFIAGLAGSLILAWMPGGLIHHGRQHAAQSAPMCGKMPQLSAYGLRSLAFTDTVGRQLELSMYTRDRNTYMDCILSMPAGTPSAATAAKPASPAISCGISVAEMAAAARGQVINKLCPGGGSVFIQRH